VARAELVEDVTTLARAYRNGGAEVTQLAPRFALAGSTTRIALSDLEGLGRGERPCATVVVMTVPTHRFELRPALPRALMMVVPGVASAAGIAMLQDCSGRLLATGGIEVTMGKQLGTLEMLVIRHADESLTAPEVVLPRRATGQLPPTEPVGALPLAPLEERLGRAEASVRRDGSTFVARVDVVAEAQGQGAIVLRLREGCHRVLVLADSTRASDGVDVDALVHLPGQEEPLARDRSHAPDARLDFCTGATEEVALRFVGAAGAAPVVVLTAYWPLPRGLPTVWGDQARAGLAWALHRRPSPPIHDPPHQLFAGAAGLTSIPVEVEPSSCYLAAMTVTRGAASGARLTVDEGARRRHDDAVDPQRAASLSFCTRATERSVRFEVDLRAQTAWWGLALWRVGDGPR
jgi:hypothetical protein